MAVSEETPFIRYEWTGTTQFPVTFAFLSPEDLQVEITGNESLDYSDDYEISGKNLILTDQGISKLEKAAADNSGKEDKVYIAIVRNTPATRDSDYTEVGKVSGASLNHNFDRAIMIAQECKERLERCISVYASENLSPQDLRLSFDTNRNTCIKKAAESAKSADAAEESADAAEGSAAAAAESADAAANSAVSAAGDADSSSASADGAQKSAASAWDAASRANAIAKNVERADFGMYSEYLLGQTPGWVNLAFTAGEDSDGQSVNCIAIDPANGEYQTVDTNGTVGKVYLSLDVDTSTTADKTASFILLTVRNTAGSPIYFSYSKNDQPVFITETAGVYVVTMYRINFFNGLGDKWYIGNWCKLNELT